MIISLDTETTGVDFWHGAAPFFVSTCDENGDNTYWEWNVDPLTRRVLFVDSDLREIQEAIDAADEVVLQNAKFDVRALNVAFGGKLRWDWGKVHDTLIAGHLLASNHAHDLTSMALEYLNVDISKYESRVDRAVQEARACAKKSQPDWRIARDGDPTMPSVRTKPYKSDMWLLRCIDPDSRVLEEYANTDSATTLALWKKQRNTIEARGLWQIYLERMKVLPVSYAIEEGGVTVDPRTLDGTLRRYRSEAEDLGTSCTRIARSAGFDLSLPRSGNNDSLRGFLFDVLRLESPKKSKKTGEPSIDKSVVEHWLSVLPEHGKPRVFLERLQGKRKRDTAIAAMEGYKRFGVLDPGSRMTVLHPSLNPTGTHTLRWSSSNPNEQSISKQEGFNMRIPFGPAPGREWWSLDAENIELRLPAYEAGEEEMIALFERPDDPPYYGSNHLLVAHILHGLKFDECVRAGESFKSRHPMLYRRVKFGNFAIQYGATEHSGTADRAYGVPGAQVRIQSRFSRIEALNKRMIAFANRHGYVETMPDRTVDPGRGYPLLCSRARDGYVLPTVPLNYHVQGSACWWMAKAMVRCHEYLRDTDARMVMQVHDELVFDLPAGRGSEPWKTNLPRMRKIRRLMEQGGDDLGVPTPVSCEYHAENWGEGEKIRW